LGWADDRLNVADAQNELSPFRSYLIFAESKWETNLSHAGISPQ
jgi:hypothetical protein